MYDINFSAKLTICTAFVHPKARKGLLRRVYPIYACNVTQTQCTYAYTIFINIHIDISNTHIYEAPSEVEINIHQCEHEAVLIIWNVENRICLKTA